MCKVEGCESPVFARGMCRKHYERVRRYGDPHKCKHQPVQGVCSVEGCEREVYAKGMCCSHYQINARRNKDQIQAEERASLKREIARLNAELGRLLG